MHDQYIGHLLNGDFRDETRAEVSALVARMHCEQTIDGVILGGTEMPLLLRSDVVADVPALDTTALRRCDEEPRACTRPCARIYV